MCEYIYIYIYIYIYMYTSLRSLRYFGLVCMTQNCSSNHQIENDKITVKLTLISEVYFKHPFFGLKRLSKEL